MIQRNVVIKLKLHDTSPSQGAYLFLSNGATHVLIWKIILAVPGGASGVVFRFR
jgi:hypothetical protein